MSNVNDNNLDDLLRRAAEKYPLRTDSADWGKLVSDLEKDPSLILPPVGEDRRRRRRRFFWLFLLLPLAGVGYYAWHTAGRSASLAEQTAVVASEKGGHDGQTSVAAGKETQAPVNAGEKGGAPVQTAGKRGQSPTNAGEKGGETAGQKGRTIVQPEQAGHVGGEHTQTGEKGVQSGQANVAGRVRQVNVSKQDNDNNKVNMPAGREGQVKVSIPTREKGGHIGGKTAGQSGHVGGETTEQIGQVGRMMGGNDVGKNVTTVQDEKGLHLASNNVQRANTKLRLDVNANNIPVKSNADSQTKDKKKNDNIKLQKPRPSFYVGILGSPDLSTIKWQSVKNVGTRYGVLLGYSFNGRWSIETGAYYSKKKYFTDGEYFDKTNAYILKYVDQLKVSGVCNMWEFPVNVRYNLSTGKNTKWFATAGASAYYMSREKYDCSGYLNGAAWWQEWDKKPSHNSWSTNLNLSVGYEQQLGRIGNLRLEPYVRVPMSGIGTGKLSIMSAGLNIGITRRIW